MARALRREMVNGMRCSCIEPRTYTVCDFGCFRPGNFIGKYYFKPAITPAGATVTDLPSRPRQVMYTNVINTAFEGITRITNAVALLEIFYTLARRDAIKQTCLKKTAYTYHLFIRYVWVCL